MKIQNFFAVFRLSPLLAVLLAGNVFGQPGPNSPPPNSGREPVPPRGAPDRSRMPGGDRGVVPPNAGMGFGGIMPMLGVLNEEQRDSMRKIMQENREETRAIEERIRTARREFMDASLQRPFSEAKVREKAMALAKAEADLNVLRSRAMSKVQPPLTDDQIERMKNPPRPNFEVPRQPDAGVQRGRNRLPTARDENDLPPRPGPAPAQRPEPSAR